MSELQRKMAAFGFESNEDYEYRVRCLLDRETDHVRCLNIEGTSDRRRTAFANALANALEYQHILYHDFTQQNPPQPDIILPRLKDEHGREEPEIDPFDQVMSETCAFSEAENTILILDQLQAADFREHMRIYHFLKDARWEFRNASYYATPKHLLVMLISEEKLFHSLQNSSFRIWVNASSELPVDYKPEDFGLDTDALQLMNRLSELFNALGGTPTRSEYGQILYDIHHRVRTIDSLRHSIFGWTEGIERESLYAQELEPRLANIIDALEGYLGTDEVELSALPDEHNSDIT